MSRLRANQITNENANGAPNFPHGLTVTGIVTASTASTTMDQIVVGSAVTANSQGIDVTGIVTATTVKVGSAISITDSAVSATRFHGDGSQLTGISVDPSTAASSAGFLKVLNASTPQIRLNNDASDGATTRAFFGIATGNNNYINGSVANDTVLSARVAGDLLIGCGSTVRMRISENGHVTKPANPSFRATASSSLDYTSDNTLAFQNEKHDVGGNYNNSNSYYTIPTTGYYKFEVMHFAQPGQIARVQLERSTDSGSSWSTIQIGPRIESSGGGRYIAGWMHVFHEFTATNLVRVRWSQGNVHINNGYGWFQGWLVQ